jgi:alkanesulfonate monooxygenase SsuD/methylene tetrahydromethanopterin reductase-like flavin-dependent oxidoreductase (luciferase family)
VLTYDFRLPPGGRTVEYALLAEDLGFRAVWCPEIPAFGNDIWVTLARIAEKRICHASRHCGTARPLNTPITRSA